MLLVSLAAIDEAYAARAATQKTVAATVVRVIDGDTVVVADEQARTYHLRLAGIDAPERKQQFGEEAREALDDLPGRHVTLYLRKHDRYGRYIGSIWLDNTDISLRQIRQGWAWHYARYAAEQPVAERTRYAQAQQEAQQHHTGLWQQADPLPPWDFRHAARGTTPNSP